MSLSLEVQNFKTWADGYPVQTRSAEWECHYENWGRLHAAVLNFVEATPPANWSATDVDNLLYAIARDNELEYLVEQIAKTPDLLLQLSLLSVQSSESAAKWQLASWLAKLDAQHPRAEAILLVLVDDKNEYVSRRALLALGDLQSVKTEALAERAWNTGQEYQRIAALWALKSVSSLKLDTYIAEAMEDGRKYLVHNAIQVRSP